MHGKQLHGSAYVVTEERRKKRFCFGTTKKEEEAERREPVFEALDGRMKKNQVLERHKEALLFYTVFFWFGFCIRLQLHMMAKGTLNTSGVWARVLAASNSNQICYALIHRVSVWIQFPYILFSSEYAWRHTRFLDIWNKLQHALTHIPTPSFLSGYLNVCGVLIKNLHTHSHTDTHRHTHSLSILL